MADSFDGTTPTLTAPVERIFAVTPSDTVDLANVPRAIWVGTSGDLAVIDAGGTTVTLHNVAGGMWHAMRPVRIKASGTTALNIRGGY